MKIAMLAFPGMQPLDFFGPYDVFDAAGIEPIVIARNEGPVDVDSRLSLRADAGINKVHSADVLFVPGGHGVTDCLHDDAFVRFLRRFEADWITSVCTGSLLLAAAGMLRGYRATSHWRYADLLELGGATVVRDERVVIDRNRITGGGVTAGIDFGVTLIALLLGEDVARLAQLALEYEPAPPYGGHPSTAQPQTVSRYIERTAKRLEMRRQDIADAISRSNTLA